MRPDRPRMAQPVLTDYRHGPRGRLAADSGPDLRVVLGQPLRQRQRGCHRTALTQRIVLHCGRRRRYPEAPSGELLRRFGFVGGRGGRAGEQLGQRREDPLFEQTQLGLPGGQVGDRLGARGGTGVGVGVIDGGGHGPNSACAHRHCDRFHCPATPPHRCRRRCMCKPHPGPGRLRRPVCNRPTVADPGARAHPAAVAGSLRAGGGIGCSGAGSAPGWAA